MVIKAKTKAASLDAGFVKLDSLVGAVYVRVDEIVSLLPAPEGKTLIALRNTKSVVVTNDVDDTMKRIRAVDEG